jgi:hypothetical protein
VSHIRHAADVNVNLTTFDSVGELEKIARWHATTGKPCWPDAKHAWTAVGCFAEALRGTLDGSRTLILGHERGQWGGRCRYPPAHPLR